jgi:hypothetical protein
MPSIGHLQRGGVQVDGGAKSKYINPSMATSIVEEYLGGEILLLLHRYDQLGGVQVDGGV